MSWCRYNCNRSKRKYQEEKSDRKTLNHLKPHKRLPIKAERLRRLLLPYKTQQQKRRACPFLLCRKTKSSAETNNKIEASLMTFSRVKQILHLISINH